MKLDEANTGTFTQRSQSEREADMHALLEALLDRYGDNSLKVAMAQMEYASGEARVIWRKIVDDLSQGPGCLS